MQPESTDARRRPDRLKLIVGTVVAVAVGLSLSSAARAAGPLLVYTGNGAINEGYAGFAAAAGRTQVTSSTLPATDAQWDTYACVVLPVPQVGFTPSQGAALNSYMQRGGTVVALAEHLNADNSQIIGPASVTALNNLASGTGIQALNTTANQGPTTTTDVLASSWTAGVSRVRFSATTSLTVTAPAIAMVRTVQPVLSDPPPGVFLALRVLGAGKFVYAGDSNVFSDGGGGPYAPTNDNARLANNVCGDISPPLITITTPQDGARYRKDQVLPAAWTCTDPDSDVNTALTTATTPVGQPINTSVPAGTTQSKSFTVTCTDNAGNTATKTVNYVVDGNPPQAVISTPVNGETYNRNSLEPADWICVDPDGASDIDTAPDKTFGTLPVGQGIDTLLPGGGAPVQKPFSVTCTDKAGNTTTTNVTYTVADQNPPVAAITSPLNGERFTIGKAPALAGWTCTDPDDNKPPGYSDIDPDENKTFGSFPVGVQIDTAGTLGQTILKTFDVTCTDKSGNVGNKSVSYYVDGNPPIVAIAVPVDGGTYQRGSSNPASWSCTDPDGDGDVKTKVATVPVGNPINTSTMGVKSFTVTCTDQAGNSTAKTVSYTVIGGPPEVTITSPTNNASYTQGQVVAPSYSCTDPDGDLKSCIRQGGATGPVDTSKGGSFSFTVNAEDQAGNKATKTVNYTVKAKAGTTPGTGVSPSNTTKKKACVSRRSFRIRVKKIKGGFRAVSATVFVNGKKTTTRKGKRITATVTLKGLKKGRYTVRIKTKYSNGRVLTYTRKFKTCTPKGK